MRIVIDIDEDIYKDIKKGKVYSSIRDVPQESVLAIANGTPLPKEATNGDMIKAMFPNVSNSNMDLVDVFKNAKSWWNAPYIEADRSEKDG